VASGRCELCGREVPTLTTHHLIPRARHRNRQTRQRFDRSEREGRLAMLCPPCHKQVHAVLSEKELERAYSSLEALRAHPEIARFVRWVAQRPPDTAITVHRPRRRR